MARRPYIHLYSNEFEGNSNIKRCTFEERGVWLYIMFLLHDSDEYGIVRWYLKDIANAIGCSVESVQSLVNKGVLKGTEKDGEKVSLSVQVAKRQGPPELVQLLKDEYGPIWYSSRMMKDEYIRERRGSGGFKALLNENVPKKRSEKDTLSSNEKDTLSVQVDCTSLSLSLKDKIKDKDKIKENLKRKKIFVLPDFVNQKDWEDFVQHRKSCKFPMTEVSVTRTIASLKKLHDEGEDIAKVIDQSIVNGWRGVFRVQNNSGVGYGKNNGHNAEIPRTKTKSEQSWDWVSRTMQEISDAESHGKPEDDVSKQV